MSNFVAPKHEPEVIAFVARKLYGGVESRVPNTMFRAFRYHGVHIESTGRQAREFEVMVAIVKALAEQHRDIITDLICHSEDGYRFVSRAMTRDASVAAEIAMIIKVVCLEHLRGHGGIEVLRHGQQKTRVPAEWGGV